MMMRKLDRPTMDCLKPARSGGEFLPETYLRKKLLFFTSKARLQCLTGSWLQRTCSDLGPSSGHWYFSACIYINGLTPSMVNTCFLSNCLDNGDFDSACSKFDYACSTHWCEVSLRWKCPISYPCCFITTS